MPIGHKPCVVCGRIMRPRKNKRGDFEGPKSFTRRRTCGRECASRFKTLQAGRVLPTDSAMRNAAKRLIPPGACEICGIGGKTHVHHKDKNPQNSNIANLQRLCPRCHVLQHHPPTRCSECDNQATSGGLCNKHYKAFRRSTGRPKILAAANPRRCSIPDCGRPHYGNGYCNMHWQRWKSGRLGLKKWVRLKSRVKQ